MRKIYALCIMLCTAASLMAQNKEDESNHEKMIRLHTLPYYSFGKGIGITSPDSIYQLKIRFRMQNRASYNINEGEDNTVDAQIRRLRLRFDGYVGNPKITYALQLSFAPGDVGEIHENENVNIIRDAVVWYQPNKRWTFGFGQTKLPGNRQRFNSSGALQLTDRSINNAKFNIDRDFGFQVHQLNMFKHRFSYNFKASVSMGEGRNFTKNDDAGLAYTGKVELYPLGAFSSQGDYFEGDLKREQKPKIMVSGAYQFNNKAKKNQGQLGTYFYDKKDLHNVFADAMLKYKGFAFMASYMSRMAKDPISVNPQDATKQVFAFVGYGMDFQPSFLTKRNYEIIGRYSFQNPYSSISHLAPSTSQYTIGLTKYIWEHAFKLLTELTYETRDFNSGKHEGSWYVRFQVEIGI
jgi:phosphate-selective porin OprO/OprP